MSAREVVDEYLEGVCAEANAMLESFRATLLKPAVGERMRKRPVRRTPVTLAQRAGYMGA